MKYGLPNPTTKTSKPERGAPKRVKVLVALRGFGEEKATQAVAIAGGGYAAKRAAYAGFKQQAKESQRALLDWLGAEKGSGSYRRVSSPTAFGTFTLEITEDLLAKLERSPLVESVLPTDSVPLTLLGGSSATSG